MDSFVTQVEQEADYYSLQDWEKSIEEYESMAMDFLSSFDEYSPEEQKLGLEAIGRYQSLAIKRGVDEAQDITEKVLDALPFYLKGFINGLTDDKGLEKMSEELEDKWDVILETFEERIEALLK